MRICNYWFQGHHLKASFKMLPWNDMIVSVELIAWESANFFFPNYQKKHLSDIVSASATY